MKRQYSLSVVENQSGPGAKVASRLVTSGKVTIDTMSNDLVDRNSEKIALERFITILENA